MPWDNVRMSSGKNQFRHCVPVPLVVEETAVKEQSTSNTNREHGLQSIVEDQNSSIGPSSLETPFGNTIETENREPSSVTTKAIPETIPSFVLPATVLILDPVIQESSTEPRYSGKKSTVAFEKEEEKVSNDKVD